MKLTLFSYIWVRFWHLTVHPILRQCSPYQDAAHCPAEELSVDSTFFEAVSD
jgi:hypothetical protein